MSGYPKDWGQPCKGCGYKWCYHGDACIARQLRQQKRLKTQDAKARASAERWLENLGGLNNDKGETAQDMP